MDELKADVEAIREKAALPAITTLLRHIDRLEEALGAACDLLNYHSEDIGEWRAMISDAEEQG